MASLTTRLLNNRRVRLGLAVAVILSLSLWFVPLIVKHSIVSWLQKNGADQATIASLRLNPFLGRVQLNGVDVTAGGVALFHNDSMSVDVSLGSLFRKEVRVEDARYHDLKLVVEQLAGGGLRLASYTLPPSLENSATAAIDSPDDVASAWAFLADRVQLSRCQVQFKSSELDLVLAIDQAELVRLSTKSGQPAGSLTLEGRINNRPVTLRLDTLEIVPELKIAGTVTLDGFAVDDLAKLLDAVLPVFSGRVDVDGAFSYQMRRDSGQLVRWEGRVSVGGLSLGNASFYTNAATLGYMGRAEVAIPPTQTPLLIEADGALSTERVKLEVPGAELVTNAASISLAGKTMVKITDAISLEHRGDLGIGETGMAVFGQQITHQSLVWQGQTVYHSNLQGLGIGVDTDGALQVAGLHYGRENISAKSASAAWQGRVKYLENIGAFSTVSIHGNLETTGDSLATDQLKLELGSSRLETDYRLFLAEKFDMAGSASWHGRQLQLATNSVEPLRLAVAAIDVVGGKIEQGGKLAVDQVIAEATSASMHGRLPLSVTVAKTGLVNLAGKNWRSWQAEGLEIDNASGRAERTGSEIFGLNQVRLTGMQLDERFRLGIDTSQIANLRLLGEENGKIAPINLTSVRIGKMQLDDQKGLRCEDVVFDQVHAAFTRQKDGQLRLMARLAEMMEPEAGTTLATKQEADAGGAPFRIGMISAKGQSTIHFRDETLAQPFITELTINRFSLGPIDSLKPKEKTALKLDATLEKRAPLIISGTISPFLAKPEADLHLELKNYPLANLSSYTIGSVGTGLASGQLQLKTTLGLANDHLIIENDLLLKKLETKTVSSDLARGLDNKLPIPLDAALAMLRDSERNISLNIPLSGPISQLDVGLGDILVTALGKAIVPAATGYLVYALGPYGALAYVGMKVGEKMLRIDLPPITYGLASADLSAEHDDYLQRVGKILSDRPETDLQICPQVGAWELFDEMTRQEYLQSPAPLEPQVMERLQQLAEQRGEKIKEYLADRFSIDRGRLLICDPQVVENPQVEPKVLLQM